ncbi:MAG: DoxX family protein [Bacteroidetes bacterium]|nr:DoxX family protein [Bacteroidota bacterium]
MNKRNNIIYWISTLWLSLGLVSTGLVQLTKGTEGPGALSSMQHLGYPDYLLTLLGIWKILAVIALLTPRLPLLKEWTYAGIFFLFTGAIYSHLFVGDPITESLPALLLIALAFLSWNYRSKEKKIPTLVSNPS